MFEQQDYSQRRTERAAFETDRLLIVGDVTLPPEGYQSRFRAPAALVLSSQSC